MKSASSPVMWFIIFVTFFLLSKIADEMTVISFVGFVTNLIGTLLFNLAKKYDVTGG
jgi:fumarate reductase subunit C